MQAVANGYVVIQDMRMLKNYLLNNRLLKKKKTTMGNDMETKLSFVIIYF